MEGRGELPEEVVHLILRKLHPLDLMRVRLVCRAWNQWLSASSSFSLSWFSSSSSASASASASAASASASASASSSSSALGFIIDSSPASLLYTDSRCSKWVPLPILPSSTYHASAHALLCLSCPSSCSSFSKASRAQFHILNPFTHSLFYLPEPPDGRVPFLVGFSHDTLTGNFKVVIAGTKALAQINRMYDVLLDLSAHLYDSLSLQWRRVAMVPGASMHYSNSVYACGHIYWLSRKSRREVLIFDVEEEYWSRLEAPWPDGCYPYSLWDWNHQLFMVGELSAAVTIWKLEGDPCAWVEYTSIPSKIIDVAHVSGEKDVAVEEHYPPPSLEWAINCLLKKAKDSDVG